MKLIVDSREQKSYVSILERVGVECTVKALKTGDYSIEGLESSFALERKSLSDFISSITLGRSRFKRELDRSRELKYFAIIIECSYYDIKNKNYYSNIDPKCVLNTIFSFSVKYNVPVFFVESREGGALAVLRLSQFYLKYYQNKEDVDKNE